MEHTLPKLENKNLERQAKIILLHVFKYMHKIKMEHAKKYGIDLNVQKEVAEATGISLSSIKRLITNYRKMSDIEEVVRGPCKTRQPRKTNKDSKGSPKNKKGSKKTHAATNSTEKVQNNLNETNIQIQEKVDKNNEENTKETERNPVENGASTQCSGSAANERNLPNIKKEMDCDSTEMDSHERTEKIHIKLEPIDIQYDGDMQQTFKMEFV